MTVYERLLANPCPPENGSVLWINTSKKPLTLNMRTPSGWQVLGAFYDAETLTEILRRIGTFTDPNATIAKDLEQILAIVESEATEEEVRAMFSDLP